VWAARLDPPARIPDQLSVSRRTSIRALSLLTLGLVTIAGTTRASGYVRKRNDMGFVQYLTPTCLLLNVHMNGFSGMTRDEVAKSVGAAAHTWSPAAVTCADGTHPYMELITTMAPDSDIAGPSTNDGQNNLAFVLSGWDLLHPEGSGALAITSAWTRPDGRIVDVDVEINADPNFLLDWRNLDPGASTEGGNGLTLVDLQNVLTHEFGHVIGFDHSCFGPADDVQMIDDQGNLVPDCGSAPAEIQQTTMFAEAASGETSKRVLSADEVRAMCEIYPAAKDPHLCAPDMANDGCGCAAAGDAGTGAGAAMLAFAALLFATRRPGRLEARAPRARRG
jgi:hypothetical protein